MSGWETYYKTEGEEEEEEEESPDSGGKWLHHVVWSAWKKDFSCLLFFCWKHFAVRSLFLFSPDNLKYLPALGFAELFKSCSNL